MRAKNARRGRDFNSSEAPKGPKGNGFANLFSGLAKCAYCGSGMWFENKGHGPKGGANLVCDKVKRGMGCPNVRWRYEDFEASFLYFVQELDLQGLLLKNDKQNEISITVQVLQGRLTILREQQSKTYELHMQSPLQGGFVARKLAELDQQIGDVEAEIARAIAAQTAAKIEAGEFTKSGAEIKTLIERLQYSTDEETYALRARVAAGLRSLVKRIRIAGAGTQHLKHKQRRVPPWWRTAPNGSLVFFVRLGGKPIEFDKGKSGIAVASAEKLPGVIDTLIAAVQKGELDTVLGQVKRPPMQKKKAA
jgi:hypothetical protein